MRTSLAVLAVVALSSLGLGACTGPDRAPLPPPVVGRGGGGGGPAEANAVSPEPETPPASKMDDANGLTKGEPSGAGAAAPAEAYDLAADRERRARVAREELGPRTITTVVSDIFVVVGPPGWQGGAFQQSVSLMRNAMAGYMNNRFGKKPAQAISVYLFPEGRSSSPRSSAPSARK